jgi:predicted HTH domain antitoxin
MTDSDIAERRAREEADLAVAVHLYEKGLVSLGRAAKIAGLPLTGFVDRLAALKIPVARYSPDELAREIAEFG